MKDNEDTYTTGLENRGRFLEQIFTDARAACLRSPTAREESDLSTATRVHSVSNNRK